MSVGKDFFFRLSGIMSIAAMVGYMSCSSNDEPEPVDCNTTTLSIEVLPAGITNPTGCDNTGSITATATGGQMPYTYALNGSTTFQSSPTFGNIGAGNYSVTVKDNQGCTKTVSNIVLTSPGGPSPGTPTTQADTQCSTDDGSITVNATGGTGTLTYSKDGTNFQSSNVFTGLRAGSYTLTIKDAANCTATVNATVPNQTGVTYDGTILAIFDAKCKFSGCHPTNGDWFTYSVARDRAQTIKQRTSSGSMPQGGVNAPGGALSADQIAAIACWADHGAPRN